MSADSHVFAELERGVAGSILTAEDKRRITLGWHSPKELRGFKIRCQAIVSQIPHEKLVFFNQI
jgi:hypothetical protein